VSVWVGRVDRPGDGTIARAWSGRSKAQSWAEAERSDSVRWVGPEHNGTGRWVGNVDGSIVATVMEVEVMDPLTLAQRYPRDLPAVRDLIADNE